MTSQEYITKQRIEDKIHNKLNIVKDIKLTTTEKIKLNIINEFVMKIIIKAVNNFFTSKHTRPWSSDLKNTIRMVSL